MVDNSPHRDPFVEYQMDHARKEAITALHKVITPGTRRWLQARKMEGMEPGIVFDAWVAYSAWFAAEIAKQGVQVDTDGLARYMADQFERMFRKAMTFQPLIQQ